MSHSLEKYMLAAGFAPNPDQATAIEHVDGPLFLTAGPGSGKTRVLLWRVLNLIVFKRVNPETIFLATFTEKAAKQLKDGLVSLLGLVTNQSGVSYDLSKMYIGTVHSLCQKILNDRRFLAERSRTSKPVILDELDQYFLISSNSFWKDAVRAIGTVTTPEELRRSINLSFTGKDSASRHDATKALVSVFNRFSEEGLSPEIVKKEHSDEFIHVLGTLYELYQTTLNDRLDLSLLQWAALERVSSCNESASHFSHIIVDEYQDTNTVQERIFFHLAQGNKCICVVGDDDQALYRFRGASVENFVEFPERCRHKIGCIPTTIKLGTNYRSTEAIVELYKRFMDTVDWRKADGGHYRLVEKGIKASRKEAWPSVFASSMSSPIECADEIASLIAKIIAEKSVSDPNQIAFLFPSLKGVAAERMQTALERVGLQVYAPRAKRFLEANEPTAIIGIYLMIFGRPNRNSDFDFGENREFFDWLDRAYELAREICSSDHHLKEFVMEKKKEIDSAIADYETLQRAIKMQDWSTDDVYEPSIHKRILVSAPALSSKASKGIGTARLDAIAKRRCEDGAPFSLKYIVSRATSLDWNILDLFYRVCGFDHFRSMLDRAEKGHDEGPVCNLALTSQYLSRYLEKFPPLITAESLKNSLLQRSFFQRFLYSVFRLGEGEFEDAEDPFPKGRIPFLTVHQSKGLEFPIVVLGDTTLRKHARKPRELERIVRQLLCSKGEPLERMGEFDTMRMFYVALSRAKHLLILAHPKGRGIALEPAFKDILVNAGVKRIAEKTQFDIPLDSSAHEDACRTYSYTSDYLAYLRCPRQYMFFRKYGFASSRTQTMFFGTVIHQTIEDLHHFLISRREATNI